MSWAARRKVIILLIVGAAIAAFAAIFSFSIFYHTPTCNDGIENQGEEGIDCGGPCPRLCTALEQAPTVLFTQPINNGTGRTDIVAMVRNNNLSGGAKDVPYSVALYDSQHLFLTKVQGTLDLPPGATVPVYIPGVPVGEQKAASAFLSIEPSVIQWESMLSDPRIVPTVSDTVVSDATTTPRVTAMLSDPAATPLSSVLAFVFVYDAQENVIAASQTIVPLIPAQGTAIATFTWNAPFSALPASAQVLPVIPLL